MIFLISSKRNLTLLNDIFLTLVLDPSLLAIPINKLFASILSIDISDSSPTLIPLSPVLLNTILLTFTFDPEKSIPSFPIILKFKSLIMPVPKSISIASEFISAKSLP